MWELIKNKSQLFTYKNHLIFWHVKTNFSLGLNLLKIQFYEHGFSTQENKNPWDTHLGLSVENQVSGPSAVLDTRNVWGHTEHQWQVIYTLGSHKAVPDQGKH